MKFDSAFGLENAAWPVLLVDGSWMIRGANRAAVEAFGTQVEGGTYSLSNLWLAENHFTPDEFFTSAEQFRKALAPVKLLGEDGVHLEYQASICSSSFDKRRYFLVQLLPDLSSGGAEAEAALAAPAPLPKPSPEPAKPSTEPPALAPVSNPEHAAAAEEASAHKKRLDFALQLARTMSMDFNNVLTSILGHTSLVLSKLEPNHPWRNSLMEVEKAAAKAAEIVTDLAHFSRQEREPKSLQPSGNINLLLQRSVEMFKSTPSAQLDKDIVWSLQLERHLHGARFDEAKMHQAFLKILENAVEALGHHKGQIIIHTRNFELTEPTHDRNARLAAGTYVCVEIEDNGSGIEADVLPKVFEPFFTTKRGDKHRGLGLAWVYGIVTNHGGAVAISSVAGKGTSVRVYLPADQNFVQDASIPAADLTGHQTVLMVDDEDLVLTMGQTVLSTYGYRVLTANSGQKAMDLIARSDVRIDLLITDLVMPTMSGRELIERVELASPATRVLRISGYVRPKGQGRDSGSYLQKPFTSQDLLLKVKQALSPQ